MEHHIATIRSLVHHQTKGSLIVGDEGFYELEILITEEEMLRSSDPQGFVNHIVAKHLAACHQRTLIPVGEGLWYVQFSPWAQEHLTMPKEFFV